MTNNTKAAMIVGLVVLLVGILTVVGSVFGVAWAIVSIIAGNITIWSLATGILSIIALYSIFRLLRTSYRKGIRHQ